jgi:hypothetical protein
MLFDWWFGGHLTADHLRQVIADVWQSAEWPERKLSTIEWVDLFRTAGFVSDPPDRQRPTEPLTIYRGTTWGRRRGMAWTEDPERAEWFAGRWASWRTGEGLVFKATIDPAGVLALIDGRKEAEVVIDPACLPPLGRAAVVRSARPLEDR